MSDGYKYNYNKLDQTDRFYADTEEFNHQENLRIKQKPGPRMPETILKTGSKARVYSSAINVTDIAWLVYKRLSPVIRHFHRKNSRADAIQLSSLLEITYRRLVHHVISHIPSDEKHLRWQENVLFYAKKHVKKMVLFENKHTVCLQVLRSFPEMVRYR